MIKKLRIKFVAITMALVTLLLCVILALVYYSTAANLESDSISMLRSIALNPPRPVPGEAAADVNLPFFAVQLGPDGEIASASGGYFDLTDAGTLSALVREALESPGSIGVLESGTLRFYRSELPGRCVIAFGDISSEAATLRGLIRTCAIIGLLGFLAFLGISIALSRWAVRPVERAWREQKEFVAAASHELRTPLTVIMTNAELAGPSPRAQNILDSAQRMKALTGQLLTLARAENEGERAEGVCDLSRAVNEAVMEYEPVCFEHGKPLSSDVDPGISVRGDEAALAGIARIFLDNAVKYSSDGGSISVTLRSVGRKRCRLTVADEGEPIEPEELEKLFRRLYRAPGAQNKPGFGLGLSIVETTVERSHGRVWCESSGGVNSFIVELPKA